MRSFGDFRDSEGFESERRESDAGKGRAQRVPNVKWQDVMNKQNSHDVGGWSGSTRVRAGLFKAALLFTAATVAVGCTDEKVSSHRAPSAPVENSDDTDGPSIKVFVGEGDSQRLVRFSPDYAPPADDEAVGKFLRAEGRVIVDSDPLLPGLEQLAVIDTSDGSIDTNEQDQINGTQPGSTLLSLAAKVCASTKEGAVAEGGRQRMLIGNWPWETRESTYLHHIFTGTDNRWFNTCDEQLSAQEVMLCSADKLAEIADSVGPINWKVEYRDTIGALLDDITVTIPPQATADRFIARDMALNALASLAQIELRHPAAGTGSSIPPFVGSDNLSEIDCTTAYGAAASGDPEYDPTSTQFDGDGVWSFNNAYFDRSPFDDFVGAGKQRLRLKSNILAASARLVRKLVDDSVRDDLAGAERKRANAGDPLEGSKAYWGAPDAEEPVYNTIRHALEVLYGRLEITPNNPSLGQWQSGGIFNWDPYCWGYPKSGPGFMFWTSLADPWRDPVVSTREQAFAVSTLEQAGIVFPLPDISSALRPEITAHLMRQAAIDAGYVVDPGDFDGWYASEPNELRDAIQSTADSISDEDLVLALKKNFYTYARLTAYYFNENSTRSTLTAVADTHQISLVPDAEAPEITDAGGLVLSDGLSRAELGDVSIQLAGYSVASQCGRETVGESLPDSLRPGWGWNVSHQSTFDLGDVYGRRLAMIRDLMDGVDDTIHDFASVAATEVRGWVGPGKIYVEPTTQDANEDIVVLTGFRLSDFGANDVSQLEDLIIRVPDVPWTNQLLTECLAGVRHAPCREPTTDDVIHQPIGATLVTGLDEEVALGLDGDVIQLRFPRQNQVGQTDIAYYAYVVKADPVINGGHGRILGLVGNPRFYLPSTGIRQHSAVVSDYRQDLVNSLFSTTGRPAESRTCSNTVLTTDPKAYCVEGMQRDAFVPLANELTSEGSGFEDSWRHYLRIAHESAATADQLGRELIDLGIQRDIRQEAALEEVANLCGSFPEVDGVGAGEGLVELSDDDSETNACINDKLTDLVFIGEDPFEFNADGQFMSAVDADFLIRTFYCPSQAAALMAEQTQLNLADNSGTDATFCVKDRTLCANGDGSHCITHGGLGFVERAVLPEARPLAEVCGGLLDMEQFHETTGTTYDPTTFLNTVRGAIWSNESGLMAAANSYRLVENLDGEWGLFLDDDPVLASLGMVAGLDPEVRADIYPACLQDTNISCTERANQVASLVLRDFSTSSADPVSDRAYAEDAIHGLAALAGSMPPSALFMPMPVANLNRLDEKVDGGQPPMYVPAWTIYSPSKFEERTGSTGVYDMEIVPMYSDADEWFRASFTDAEIMSGLPLVSDGFLAGRDDSGLYGDALADDYANEIIPNKDAYLVYWAANAGIDYQDDIFNSDGYVRADGSDPLAGTRSNLESWYRQFTEAMNGQLGAFSLRDRIAGLFHLEPGQASGVDPQFSTTVISQGGVCPQDYGGPAFVQAYGKQDADGNYITALGNYWPRVDFVVNENAFVDIDGQQFGFEPFNTFLYGRTPPQVPRQNLRSYYFDGLFGGYEIESTSGVEREWRWWPSDWSSFVQLGFNPVKPNDGFLSTGVIALPADVYDSSGVPEKVFGKIRPEGYYRLSPKKCGAHQRMEMALPEPDRDTVIRGLGMACLAAAGGARATEVFSPPSSINSVKDIRQLEQWMLLVADTVNTVGGLLYLTDVPQSVVDSIKGGTVDSSTVGQGIAGQVKLDIAESLRSVQSGFAHLAIHFDTLRGEMRATRIRLQRIELDRQAAQLATERDSLEINRQRMVDHTERALRETQRTFERMTARNTMIGALGEAAAASVQTGFSFGTSGGAGIYSNTALAINSQLKIDQVAREGVFDRQVGRINDEFYSEVSGVIAAQGQNNEQRAQNDIQAALTDLGLDAQQAYGGIVDSLAGVQNGTSDALGGLNQLRLNRQSASVALMKAAGADFVETNGQEVPLHLNTVYRRQFGVLKERYQRALDSAKRAAYLARLSIEQRLGVRFDDFHEDVGPLAPPSVWVDDLCSLQGVDYNALREATPPSEGGTTQDEEVDLIKGFADQYIGDYVDDLEELLEFYNLQNPFKEADDSTIVSMREVLGKDGQSCARLSKNLLFHSDHLEIGPIDSDDGSSPQGWRVSGCDEIHCLNVLPGLAMSNPQTGAPVIPPQGVGAATLLQTINADGAIESYAVTTTEYGAPGSVVYQTVELPEGERYTLSWWDMARGSVGEPLAEAAAPYRVTVYDEDWAPVATVDVTANGSADGTEWALRRLEFSAFADGDYHIAFAPSLPTGDPNTIAIANVQLEVQTTEPQGYESTRASRLVASADCGTDDPASFRNRFSYKCTDTGCYYELNTLLNIDTELLNRGNSALEGLLAAGNHNYRHVNLVANVVGTGVLDCRGSDLQSCYGSGFIEYDLEHTAFNVPLIDSRGKTTCFNFGGGSIRNGKALATERFLTLPLGSADKDLISQNSLTRTQFAGRPLSGSYRLRIKDSPALVWENVEDVQLILDYRYWSSVDTSN